MNPSSSVLVYLPAQRISTPLAHKRQISAGDVFSLADHLPTARILNKNRYLLSSYAYLAHSILTAVLAYLDPLVGLNPCQLAKPDRLSPSHSDLVCFNLDRLHAAECVAPAPRPYTAGGTALALFFDRPGALQMLIGGQHARYEYICPLPGHVLVRLGDASEMLSNHQLQSHPHRVLPTPDQQTGLPRSSVAYIMRSAESSSCEQE